MILWGSVGPLLLISLAIMGSPGPATIGLVTAGSVYGVRRSIPYLIGIIVGTTIVLVAVATGITATILAVPAVGSVLIWISAGYIVWLAYHIATASTLSEPTAASGAFPLAGGAVLGVANPKAWVAITAVFASARLADAATLDAAAKIAVLTVMIIVICTTWLVAGTSMAPLLRNPRRARLVNAALAVGLVGATALAVLHLGYRCAISSSGSSASSSARIPHGRAARPSGPAERQLWLTSSCPTLHLHLLHRLNALLLTTSTPRRAGRRPSWREGQEARQQRVGVYAEE